MRRQPPTSPLFPYTTLFRSLDTLTPTPQRQEEATLAPRLKKTDGYLEFARPARELVKAVGLLRSEEHTSELQSRENLVCRLLLEKKKQRYDLEGQTVVTDCE